MNYNRLKRKAAWLMPGISLKRWLGAAAIGLVLLAIGMALTFNLQPITLLIKVLQRAALVVPSHISGPICLVVGVGLLYWGSKRTYQTFNIAAGGNTSLMETLYRQYKLAQGPRVVAIGGGTGLSTLLRGIKHHTNNITAVVTVGDDGGSSGRLRKEQGVIPPGDIRNCIAALADEEDLITELFQYRFKNGQGLEGHSFGNLFLTALCRISGDMMSAIKESSKVLNIRGRVLPSTLANVTLAAEMSDGSVIQGESQIPDAKGKINRLFCTPKNPAPLPEVIQAINQADIILMGPGSLYTSVIPNLLIAPISEAVNQSKAPKIYVTNLVTQPGETDGYTVGDHVSAINSHAGYNQFIDIVFVNDWLPEPLVEKYKAANAIPVVLDKEVCENLGTTIVETSLVDQNENEILRHNSKKLAHAILTWYKAEWLKGKAIRKPVYPIPPITEAGTDVLLTEQTPIISTTPST